MKIENKKSAVDLTELAIGIVVLGIVVSISAVLLNNMAKTQITNAPTYQIHNETVVTSGAGFTLSSAWVKSIDVITNTTSGTVINSGNFTSTISTETGLATIQNTTSLFKPNWNVSYTVYNTTDPRYSLPKDAEAGLGEYGNWFKIIAIVGIAAVILALIFAAFGKANQSSGGTAY